MLTLLGFFYARPASVLLVDEPDAHLHVILQREVYDLLRSVARRRRCQLLVSTHSKIILQDTGAEQILSFYGPYRLTLDTHRDQVREALKRLSSLEILTGETGQNILFMLKTSRILRFSRRLLLFLTTASPSLLPRLSSTPSTVGM